MMSSSTRPTWAEVSRAALLGNYRILRERAAAAGDRSSPANFRPISLTSVLIRFFERVVLYRLRPLITKHLAKALGNYIGTNPSECDRICNEAIRLYQVRGNASHDGQEAAADAVRESYLLARNMFIGIIASGVMPTGGE